jgi:DNA primase
MQSNEQSKLLLEVVTRYSQNIDEATLGYLEGRGISKQVADQFMLGTVVDPAPGHEQFEGWLSIPYITALGMAVSVKFRRLDDGKPKYGQPTGQKLHLYNVTDVAVDSSRIVVTEGELDAVIISGILGIPAVGVPGVAAWKPYYAKLMTGFDTVYVVGDNDLKEDGTNPGAEFSKRVASEIINSHIVQLPLGMDINEFYLQHGPTELSTLLGGVK